MLSAKAQAKQTKMSNPGYESKYARKHKFLVANGGRGFDYPDKPWK